MNVKKTENKLCLNCMQVHDVDIVEVMERETFKDQDVDYLAIYEYCSLADGFLETEPMIRANNLAMKDAYRVSNKLLTSDEIRDIRDRYAISQKDLALALDWGLATITRYETHQVQDRVHDDVLRKIADDPAWFLELLERSRQELSAKSYEKYVKKAKEAYRKKENQYLQQSITADYMAFRDESLGGGVDLNLDKVVEMINFFAGAVTSLHKVKLMKMLWYADTLHYKRHGHSISGLVYKKFQMGAAPEAHDKIISLEGIHYETLDYGEHFGYRFFAPLDFEPHLLEEDEIAVLQNIVDLFGAMNAEEIVGRMHQEEAFEETKSMRPISYKLAQKLSIS